MKAEITENTLSLIPESSEEQSLIVSWIASDRDLICGPLSVSVENRDFRDPLNGWYGGVYPRTCPCGVEYFGGKRSESCAPCAYKPKKVVKKKTSKKKWRKKK